MENQARDKFEQEREELRRECAARKVERENEPKRRYRRSSGRWGDDAIDRLVSENKRLRAAVNAIMASELVSDEAKGVLFQGIKPV